MSQRADQRYGDDRRQRTRDENPHHELSERAGGARPAGRSTRREGMARWQQRKLQPMLRQESNLIFWMLDRA
jgi:hypothetical protein